MSNVESSKRYKWEIAWSNVFYMTVLHVATAWGLWLLVTLQIKWQTFLIGSAATWVSCLGITIGAHRYWTHRTFKAKRGLQIFLMFIQTMAGEGSVYNWARDHRVHHKFSDTDADPHNSKRGFFFCHMGWLMLKKHPEVSEKGKLIDLTDLNSDPLVQFQRKYYTLLHFLICFAFPTSLPLLFGESFQNSLFTVFFVKYFVVLHGTWSVNSLAHMYGMKPYTKDIEPTENAFVSFLTSGEGWHNYHHSFPWDYRASEFGTPLNASGLVIDFFHYMGWATDLKYATAEMVSRRAQKQGDGSHPIILGRRNATRG